MLDPSSSQAEDRGYAVQRAAALFGLRAAAADERTDWDAAKDKGAAMRYNN